MGKLLNAGVPMSTRSASRGSPGTVSTGACGELHASVKQGRKIQATSPDRAFTEIGGADDRRGQESGKLGEYWRRSRRTTIRTCGTRVKSADGNDRAADDRGDGSIVGFIAMAIILLFKMSSLVSG